MLIPDIQLEVVIMELRILPSELPSSGTRDPPLRFSPTLSLCLETPALHGSWNLELDSPRFSHENLRAWNLESGLW